MFRFKKKTIEKDAQYVFDIVEKYSNDKKIKKYISQISDEYFLVDDINKISVCIDDGIVTIANHDFLYKKVFSVSFTDKLKKNLKKSMEAEIQFLKKTLFNNETDLLTKILELPTVKEITPVISHNFKCVI